MKAETKKAPSEATKLAMANADVFVRAARERAAADKEYQVAKAGLKDWLGTALSKVLPDGRTVALSIVPRGGYTVLDGTTATLTVSAPPIGLIPRFFFGLFLASLVITFFLRMIFTALVRGARKVG